MKNINIPKNKILITSGIILLLITITIILTLSFSKGITQSYKSCDKDNYCNDIKEQLKTTQKTFIISPSLINLKPYNGQTLFFGIKNIYSQNLTLYPKVNCTNLFENSKTNSNYISAPYKIKLSYENIGVYAITAKAPGKVGKYLCILMLYNDEIHTDLFLQKPITLSVI